jgi:hypothetical protein
MRRYSGGLLCILLIFCVTIISWKPADYNKKRGVSKGSSTARELLEKYASNIYISAHLQESGLALDVFNKAITGFINLKKANKVPQNTSVLTVIDLAKSSTEKRMWIIDVLNKELILNTWVAHGHGSGKNVATRFSDKTNSFKSSLGFYVTDQVYYGKHGRSLRLDGMDAGFNLNARKREIVVHAADYVGENVIEKQGRLGCSQGCPAVAPEVADQVIDAIKDKTALFINGNSRKYSSRYLDKQVASSFIKSDLINSNESASL